MRASSYSFLALVLFNFFCMRVHVLFLDMNRIALADKGALEDAQPPSPACKVASNTQEKPQTRTNSIQKLF